MLISYCNITQHHNPEDHDMNLHYHENLKSYIRKEYASSKLMQQSLFPNSIITGISRIYSSLNFIMNFIYVCYFFSGYINFEAHRMIYCI